MRIEHIGLWVQDLEKMKNFYETYFGAKANELYHNKTTSFKSYFLTFSDGARLEIMTRSDIPTDPIEKELLGFTHLAIDVGSKEMVDELVKKLVNDGYALLNGPRTTGDGYYEAVVKDPEGNRLEITQ